MNSLFRKSRPALGFAILVTTMAVMSALDVDTESWRTVMLCVAALVFWGIAYVGFTRNRASV